MKILKHCVLLVSNCCQCGNLQELWEYILVMFKYSNGRLSWKSGMWKSVMRFCFDIVVEVRKCGHLSLMS